MQKDNSLSRTFLKLNNVGTEGEILYCIFKAGIII